MWEIAACIDGINRMNGGSQIEPPTDEEFDDMIERATSAGIIPAIETRAMQ